MKKITVAMALILTVGSLSACSSDSPDNYTTPQACIDAGYDWDVDDTRCEEIESKKKKKKKSKTKTKSRSR